MTTKAAKKLYIAQHEYEWESKGFAVYNPNNKPINKLPVIYGFNNGGSGNWLYAQLISEDGTGLGSHICSHEDYMAHDLGCMEGSRPDRHEEFRQYYPDGYKMEFVGSAYIDDHNGLNKAFQKAAKKVQ